MGSVGRVDVLSDRIYQEAEIHYVVKNDPEKAEIVVKGFAVFHKRPEDSHMSQWVGSIDGSSFEMTDNE